METQQSSGPGLRRTTVIQEVTCEDILKEVRCICFCAYYCHKYLCRCKRRVKRYLPLLWSIGWIVVLAPWTWYTSSYVLQISFIPFWFIQLTLITVTTFSILSMVDVLMVLCVHPGPIDEEWKRWNGEEDTKPMVPIHCRTRLDDIDCGMISGSVEENLLKHSHSDHDSHYQRDHNNNNNNNNNDDDDVEVSLQFQVQGRQEKVKVFTDKRYCSLCTLYKPPRAHHCSQCGICVDRMDHHCVWLNKCIGFGNHRYFIQFLVYYLLNAICITPYLCVLTIVMLYNLVCDFGLILNVAWIFTFGFSLVLVSSGFFIVIYVSSMVHRQLFRQLGNDTTFIELAFDKKVTHGQYSKGSKWINWRFYLCRKSPFHCVLPIP